MLLKHVYKKIIYFMLFMASSLLFADVAKNYQPPRCGLPPADIQKAGSFKAYWAKDVSWKPGDTIDVYFVNGTNEQKARFKHYASEWVKYANLNFNFQKGSKTDDKLGIVVKFGEISPGVCGTSLVGYGSTAMSEPSVHIDCWQSGDTILHEMGHTLGLSHEQMNPAAKNDWIKSKAYEYFQKEYDMNKEQVDEALFNKFEAQDYDWTAFDRYSVMGYYIPGELFKDGRALETGNELSAGDKEAIQKIYPGRPYPKDDLATVLYVDTPVNMDLILRSATFKLYINDKLVQSIDKDVEGQSILLSKHFVKDNNKIRIVAVKKELDSEISFSLSHQKNKYLQSIYCRGLRCSIPVKDNLLEYGFYLKKLDTSDYYGLVSYNNGKIVEKPVDKPAEKVTTADLKKWVGKYTCPEFGAMELKMTEGKENALEGVFEYEGGALWGVISGQKGSLFTGNWLLSKGDTQGSMYFQYQDDGKLRGKWAYDGDKNWQDDWNCTKLSTEVTKVKKKEVTLTAWAKKYDCGDYGKLELKVKDEGKKILTGIYNSDHVGYLTGSVSGSMREYSGQWSEDDDESGDFRFELKDWGLEGFWRSQGEEKWHSGWNCKEE